MLPLIGGSIFLIDLKDKELPKKQYRSNMLRNIISVFVFSIGSLILMEIIFFLLYYGVFSYSRLYSVIRVGIIPRVFGSAIPWVLVAMCGIIGYFGFPSNILSDSHIPPTT